MAIRAFDWRGQELPAERLLNRYRMTIEPAPEAPAWKVTELREVHGRASLHVEIDGGRVDLDWSTVAGLVIPAWTNDHGQADLPVNQDSYYRPVDGPGPHRVKPAGSADRVTGWGLALGLPDGPPAEIDNRYQTVAVRWAWLGDEQHDPQPAPLREILRSLESVAADLDDQIARLRRLVEG